MLESTLPLIMRPPFFKYFLEVIFSVTNNRLPAPPTPPIKEICIYTQKYTRTYKHAYIMISYIYIYYIYMLYMYAYLCYIYTCYNIYKYIYIYITNIV